MYVKSQYEYFRHYRQFGGYPADWFRTLAGGILQELIHLCGNEKLLVAERAGMRVSNLNSIINGNNDAKLGTLLKVIDANGFEFRFQLVPKTRRRS